MTNERYGDLVTTDPVELGSILLTLVEPHRGHEVAYNRWYERDHFYSGCMIGPFNFAGGRFVATRRLKALRYPQPSPVTPDPMTGSYLALYWVLKGHHKGWNRWARDEVRALIEADRMFPHREHIHTQLYTYEGAVFRDPDPVPAELALDHPFRGLVAVWSQAAEGREREEVLEAYRTEHLPGMLSGSAAAMSLCFLPIPMPSGQPSDVPQSSGDEQRFVHLFFLDRDPAEVWEELFVPHAQTVKSEAQVLLASPFIPTVPGTDTYTDDLW